MALLPDERVTRARFGGLLVGFFGVLDGSGRVDRSSCHRRRGRPDRATRCVSRQPRCYASATHTRGGSCRARVIRRSCSRPRRSWSRWWRSGSSPRLHPAAQRRAAAERRGCDRAGGAGHGHGLHPQLVAPARCRRDHHVDGDLPAADRGGHRRRGASRRDRSPGTSRSARRSSSAARCSRRAGRAGSAADIGSARRTPSAHRTPIRWPHDETHHRRARRFPRAALHRGPRDPLGRRSVLLSPVWHEWRDGGFNIGDPRERREGAPHPARSPGDRGGVRAELAEPKRRGPRHATLTSEGREELSRRLSVRYLGAGERQRLRRPGSTRARRPRGAGVLRAWDYVDETAPSRRRGAADPARGHRRPRRPTARRAHERVARRPLGGLNASGGPLDADQRDRDQRQGHAVDREGRGAPTGRRRPPAPRCPNGPNPIAKNQMPIAAPRSLSSTARWMSD